MTDTMVENRYEESEEDTQVRGFYKRIWNQIAEIDEKLDAGSEAAGKRKVTNELVETTKGEWEPVAKNIVTEMEKMEPSELAGVFYGLVREISKAFKDPVEAFVTAQVEAMPKTEDTLTDDQKKALAAERSELATQIKLIVNMAGTFGEYEEGQEWELPKRRGAVGKRGKRALSYYDWSIDGVDVSDEDNSVKGISALLGFDKQADFTKALKECEVEGNKLDTTNPPDRFSVEINGKTVTAVKGSTEEDPNTVPTDPSGVNDDDENEEEEEEEEDE